MELRKGLAHIFIVSCLRYISRILESTLAMITSMHSCMLLLLLIVHRLFRSLDDGNKNEKVCSHSKQYTSRCLTSLFCANSLSAQHTELCSHIPSSSLSASSLSFGSQIVRNSLTSFAVLTFIFTLFYFIISCAGNCFLHSCTE